MDRSILRLPDPNMGAPHGERRRSVRQKLHTPVYASFNGPQTDLVVDLSELLDLHEFGFAVRTNERLEVNRAVTLCLDLPETKNYVHGNGQVIWSDDAGRGGVRFSALSETAQQVLKEWLFANLLIACSNHAARTGQLALHEEEKLPEPAPAILAKKNASNVVSISEGSGSLSLVEVVRCEVGEIGDDVDAVLRLITESALNLTGASGAALAFLSAGKMICRARSGEPAPPLGALVDVKQGLSGECVRSRVLVSCEDAENDSRVDPEVCRALGIGSFLAAPIVSDFQTVGLLEVFSPHARGFTKAHETILGQLVELVPKTGHEKTPPEPPDGEEVVSGVSRPDAGADLTESGSMRLLQAEQGQVVEILEPEILEPEIRQEGGPAGRFRVLRLGLLGLAIVMVAMVVGYLIQPMIAKRWPLPTQASGRPLIQSAEAASPASGRNAAGNSSGKRATLSLADLQKRAEQGDADAEWLIGERWHSGEEVPQDDTEAIKWFQRAAEQGHVDAQATLGAYYWAGRGVPQDLSKAYFWSTIALAEGDENSKSRLEGLASQMTQTQVSVARQQAEVWIRSHNQRAKSEAN